MYIIVTDVNGVKHHINVNSITDFYYKDGTWILAHYAVCVKEDITGKLREILRMNAIKQIEV